MPKGPNGRNQLADFVGCRVNFVDSAIAGIDGRLFAKFEHICVSTIGANMRTLPVMKEGAVDMPDWAMLARWVR